MVRPAIHLAEDFAGHLHSLGAISNKMEQLFAQGNVVRRDIEQVYSGLYLDAYTHFERLIENLFIGILAGRLLSAVPGVAPRITFKSDRVARDVVNGERNYVDWLPYFHTENRAKAFFRNGLPFTSLAKSDKDQIVQLGILRNVIAHRSYHSIRQFANLTEGLTLMVRERTPAGFLRSQYRAAPVETRFQNFTAQMATTAQKLCM